ncbi:hypothetical protein [Reichenbachiella versicolor]|uniref:hypothetical protein n=1 Tax=Reichenbachiella versicolor TaxID=1821036 RepID=UPI0013A59751|nr:hypothetical protein [Reichenbachiella versicolor]
MYEILIVIYNVKEEVYEMSKVVADYSRIYDANILHVFEIYQETLANTVVKNLNRAREMSIDPSYSW